MICFGGSYILAFVAIVGLYYSLPVTDAAKTSWFPIILFDPFVLTVAFFLSSCTALTVFLLKFFYLLIEFWFFSKNSEQTTVERRI